MSVTITLFFPFFFCVFFPFLLFIYFFSFFFFDNLQMCVCSLGFEIDFFSPLHSLAYLSFILDYLHSHTETEWNHFYKYLIDLASNVTSTITIETDRAHYYFFFFSFFFFSRITKFLFHRIICRIQLCARTSLITSSFPIPLSPDRATRNHFAGKYALQKPPNIPLCSSNIHIKRGLLDRCCDRVIVSQLIDSAEKRKDIGPEKVIEFLLDHLDNNARRRDLLNHGLNSSDMLRSVSPRCIATDTVAIKAYCILSVAYFVINEFV